MKKTISILTMFMLMFSFITLAAPPVPAPIRGYFTVNGESLSGYIVEVQNLRTGEVISGHDYPQLITESAGFAFDLSYFSQGYAGPTWNYVGDEIKVNIQGFGSEGTIQFNVPEDTPYTIRIEITSSQIIIQCWDGSNVVDINDCPDIPEQEPEVPEEIIETKVTSSGDSANVEAYLGQEFNIKLWNNKLPGLLDTKIDFMNEDIDVREEIYVNGIIKTSLDDEDFGLNPYILFEEDSIEYRYIIEDKIDIYDINIDDPLTITFLGKELNIIEASETEIVIRTGTETTLNEGQSIEIDGKTVKITSIAAESVEVSVDDVKEIIVKYDDKKVNGIYVLIDTIHYKGYDSDIKSSVTILVGKETDQTIKDGDDFELFEEDAEEFRWVIDLEEQYIGIINNEYYKSIDEDEDFTPIKLSEQLVLPNDYLAIEFNDISESDTVELDIKVKDEWLYVRGDSEESFIFGTDEYERLYIKEDGFYNKDKEFITSEPIRIGESDIYLELGSLKIGKLTILLDMSDILYDGISYLSKDKKYLDYLGIIFEDPENAIDDKGGFKVTVPEDRPEVTISFTQEIKEVKEPVESTPIIKPKPVPVVKPTPEPAPVVKPKPTPVPTEPEVKPVSKPVPTTPAEPEDESNLKTFLIALIASIIGIFAWGKGFAGLIKYYLRLAEETDDKELAKKYRDRAEKMAKTVVTNFLAGKYKK